MRTAFLIIYFSILWFMRWLMNKKWGSSQIFGWMKMGGSKKKKKKRKMFCDLRQRTIIKNFFDNIVITCSTVRALLCNSMPIYCHCWIPLPTAPTPVNYSICTPHPHFIGFWFHRFIDVGFHGVLNHLKGWGEEGVQPPS